MSILRKLITTKQSPEQHHRFYKAANPNRLTDRWSAMSVPMDYTVRASLKRLRARSRDMFENTEMIRRFTQVLVTNIIGHHGILLAPAIETPAGLLDTVVNQTLYDEFECWGSADNCTLQGNVDFKELQRIVVRTLAIDGEAFVRMYRGSQYGKYGFQLDLIDPELIDVNYCTTTPAGNYVEAGIEYDSTSNRPIAYYVSQLPVGLSTYTYGGGNYARIPAEEILHVYLPERVGQRRGIPWTATVADTVTMHNAFAEAAVTAARIGAAQSIFLTTPGGTGYQGDASDKDGNLFMDIEPGTIRQLPVGQTIEAFNPTYPSAMYADFEKAILRRMASGLGVSYNTLASDMESVSYSSMRVGVADDRENFMVVQDLLISRLVRPAYNAWLRAQLLQGSLQIPQKNGKTYILKFSDEDKYRKVKFQAKKWVPVDETKAMNANVLALMTGLKSRSEIIRERGKEPSKVWEEIENENKYMKTLGLNFDAEDIAAQAQNLATDVEAEQTPIVKQPK